MPNAENARGNTLARRFNSSPNILNVKSFLRGHASLLFSSSAEKRKANMSSCALLSPRMFCICTFYATTTLN